MRAFRRFWAENLRSTLREWESGEVLIALLAYLIGALGYAGLKFGWWKENAGIFEIASWATIIGAGWYIILLVFINPARMWDRATRKADDAEQELALRSHLPLDIEECEPEPYPHPDPATNGDRLVLFRFKITNKGKTATLRCEGRWIQDRAEDIPSPQWDSGWEGTGNTDAPIGGGGGHRRLNVAVFDSRSRLLRPCKPSENALEMHDAFKQFPEDQGVAIGLRIWKSDVDLGFTPVGIAVVADSEFGVRLSLDDSVLPLAWGGIPHAAEDKT